MTSSSPAPKLPIWVFLATYVVLLATAGLLAYQNPRPWSEGVMIAIVALVLAAAGVMLIPTLARYERQKNEMLDDRQRALEALARTVANSAEQISIATGGLHDIAELAQKNLRHAEQLPHKLQEKIAEFQAQLANANDVEREELEKELEELRSSESERLQSISDRIAKTTSEFAKIESATHQHLTAANEAVGKLAFGTASAIGKAQAAAEQALSQARQEAARTIGDATGHSVKAIESAKSSAVADLTTQVDAQVTRLQAILGQLASAVEQLQRAADAKANAPVVDVATPPSTSANETPVAAAVSAEAPETPAAAAETMASETPPNTPAVEPPPAPSKRQRKPRREESEPHVEPAAPTIPAESAPVAAPVTEPEPAASVPAEQAPTVAATPPVPEPASEATPALVSTTAGEGPAPVEAPAGSAALSATETPAANAQVAVSAPDIPKPARKRATRKSDDDNQPGLGLSLYDEGNGESGDSNGASGVVERVLTSDGATRLIVTAYIGIGNRLFIRGNGPGLSWEKGVPLQFVSIGKWRWETNEASTPIQFKLLKNDEQETAGLGQLTIDPGHQHEVTATF